MIVHVPSALRSYTDARETVEADGGSLAELLTDLDWRFPGLRFRIVDEQESIRPHIRLFIGLKQARTLATALDGSEEIHILCALSGG